jgi:hypothetical protein
MKLGNNTLKIREKAMIRFKKNQINTVNTGQSKMMVHLNFLSCVSRCKLACFWARDEVA